MNELDLGHGYYRHLPRVSVGDIREVTMWLASKGAPEWYRLFAPRATGIIAAGDSPNAEGLLPTEIEWGKDGKTHSLDAVLVYNFPHVALTELKQAFGFGNPNVLEFYTAPRRDVGFATTSPIGVAWPEKGLDAYRSIGAEDTYPYGAIWTDASGSYRKEESGWWVVKYAIWRKIG